MMCLPSHDNISVTDEYLRRDCFVMSLYYIRSKSKVSPGISDKNLDSPWTYLGLMLDSL